MNERIKELLAEAGFDVKRLLEPHPGGFPRDDILALESFAELIVRKCAKSADDWYQNHDKIHCDPMSYVLAHFGVEE